MKKKNEMIAVAIVLMAVGIVFFWSRGLGSKIIPGIDNNNNKNSEMKKENNVNDISGDMAKNGDLVSIHYIGALENGKKFDSSIDRGQPFEFTLGAGQVIKGFDKGILGMKIGDKKRIVISPEDGYGNRQVGSIPPNSTLIFDVELLGIKPSGN